MSCDGLFVLRRGGREAFHYDRWAAGRIDRLLLAGAAEAVTTMESLTTTAEPVMVTFLRGAVLVDLDRRDLLYWPGACRWPASLRRHFQALVRDVWPGFTIRGAMRPLLEFAAALARPPRALEQARERATLLAPAVTAAVVLARVVALACVLAGCRTTPAEPAAPTRSTDLVVIGRSITIDSKALGETRRINIYTPPDYASSGLRYPVLYMPDGGLAEDFHHITGLVQVSAGNGTMRPLIVVGVENTERRRDLTGPTDDPEDRKIAPRVGGSADFRRFLRDELMPEIRGHYRVTDETAIVGESLAGLFVLETFLQEPELFDTYIAVDPSVWWNRQALVRDAADALQRTAATPRTLYVATADVRETVDGVQVLVDALRRVGSPAVRWFHAPMPAETHATIFHPAALRAFRTVFAPR